MPGAEYLDGIELKTGEEPFGIILHYDGVQSDEQFEASVAYNAAFLFALVQNVDWISFKWYRGEVVVGRDDVEEWYGGALAEVQNEDELRQLVRSYLEDGREDGSPLKQGL